MSSINTKSESAPSIVYLGLGANVGDPAGNLRAAFGRLKNEVLTGARLSSLYITEPMDVKKQPDFINAVCTGSFSGSPEELLEAIHLIEGSLGRNRAIEQRRGPRPIDIDILLFGSLVINNPPKLVVPHERLLERKFALTPMLELTPTLKDPENGEAYSAALSRIDDQWIQRFD